jgi:hypothetical protein
METDQMLERSRLTLNEAAQMAWWGDLPDSERDRWLTAAGTTVVADAWEAWNAAAFEREPVAIDALMAHSRKNVSEPLNGRGLAYEGTFVNRISRVQCHLTGAVKSGKIAVLWPPRTSILAGNSQRTTCSCCLTGRTPP